MDTSKKIFITGATGNVGMEVIRFLFKTKESHKVVAGVRDIEKARQMFINYPDLYLTEFNFEDERTFDTALEGVDCIFLLRPPHISKVNKVVRPLINRIKLKGVKEVLFLSVQGAERSRIIPHNKIERILLQSGLKYIFLRPSYFMQNLTTVLINDIKNKRRIVLPSGNAKFNWIDVRNIGEISAELLLKFKEFQNKTYELTGYENENFKTVAQMISERTGVTIRFKNVNPLEFFQIEMSKGMNWEMVMVMFILHFLPQFQREPAISDFFKQIKGRNPATLSEFIEDYKNSFI